MHLDLLSIPQSGGKMLRHLGGIMDCKDKTLFALPALQKEPFQLKFD